MAKLVKCKACDADISSSAKVCPSCGHKNKKPIFKQWWFYVVTIVVILFVIGSSGGSDDSVSNQQPNNAEPVTNIEAENTMEVNSVVQNNPSENHAVPEQSALDDKSAEPAPIDLYKLLEENPELPFTLSPKAEAFLNEYPELFSYTGSTDKLSDYTDFDLETKHINKNPNNYGDKLMYLRYAVVNQIFEEEVSPTLTLTELNLVDEYGDQHYVFYLGKLGNIFENDEVEVYGLPLSTSSFDNTEGGQTLVVVLAGSYVEKPEY